ncbi:Hypothetical protein NTJ_01343 [Nesidiocoris tenuis]|uniref:Uncharacterized protein n=1 Tax=Nesidiocoris tenuis TaxID=355587 RepID=A0ABN7AE50_9HEMI|nr:Hypothetical protein NTJ_01343 [Nesidiocoris tenuis]
METGARHRRRSPLRRVVQRTSYELRMREPTRLKPALFLSDDTFGQTDRAPPTAFNYCQRLKTSAGVCLVVV